MARIYWLAKVGVAAALGLSGASLQAQAVSTARMVRQADPSLVGRQVMLAGRVLLGSGVLDSARLSIFVEDSGGSALVESQRGTPLVLVPGDSVWAVGIVDHEGGIGQLKRAVVTRVAAARSAPQPLNVPALEPAHLAALASRLVIVEGTVVTRNIGRGDHMLTIGDTIADGNYLTVVEEDDGNVPLGLERFSVGDRVRVTGVLTRRRARADGVSRYAIYPRGEADIDPTQLTARTRTRIVHGSALSILTLAIVAIALYTRRRAEMQRRRALAAAEQLSLGYQALVEQAPIGIVVHDERRVVYANTAFVALVGAPSAGCLQTARFSDFVHIDTAEMDARLSSSATHGTQAMRLRRHDGVVLDVEVAESRIRYAGRDCVQMVVHDVSERIRAERALADGEVRARQSQKLEAVGQLAGGVAHDFNNILTIIKGNAALMLEGCPACRAVAEEGREIDRAADRGAALTGQLLAFSRKQLIKPTTLEVDSLVKNLERMLRRLVPENVEHRLSLNAPRSYVLADAGQLEQVIVNIAVNARDAMSTGGILAIRTTNVVVDADSLDRGADLGELQPGHYVCVAVSDTGVGMDEETRRRAFEPFFTTKDPGKGTGLGLATVYGIAKQNHGYVLISSLKGMGTTVRVYLPRVDVAPRESHEPVHTESPGPGIETLLIVEDEPTIRRLAARVLRRSGYVVLEAANGMEAISTIRQHDGVVDLLITDVIMPGLSGPEVASHMCRERPGLRVLFMSGYTDDLLMEHGVLRSEVELLHKPFAPEDLLRRVKLILQGRALTTA